VLASYSGLLVGMSFDPDQSWLWRETDAGASARHHRQRDYDDDYWKK